MSAAFSILSLHMLQFPFTANVSVFTCALKVPVINMMMDMMNVFIISSFFIDINGVIYFITNSNKIS
jgi:hypothetical protein